MIVYRLSKSKYAHDLSGKGAEKYGGRWNSRGVPMIYTSGSRALCILEIAVHTPLGNLPTDYCLISIDIPEDCISELEAAKLPNAWNSSPHGHKTQVMGDAFAAECAQLVFKVPAAVVQGEFNYLINPLHPDFRNVKIVKVEEFNFDKRLFRK